MFDPLKVAHNRSLLLRLKLQHDTENFQCIRYTLIDNGTQLTSARYTLQSIATKNIVILEVFKDKHHNFHMQAYQLLEEYPFTPVFASMLGTSSIHYISKKYSTHKHTIYRRILHQNEKVDIIKYVCDIEDLPEHPSNLGYIKDGRGSWYQLLERSRGRIKNFTDKGSRRCWEYENGMDTRLLIEKDETAQEEENIFYVYLGQKVLREQIHIIPRSPKLSTLIRYQKSLLLNQY